MTHQDTDQELVKRSQQGDQAAFSAIVRKYQHKLAKLISRYIRDPFEVQDVTQEAFIKAYRGLKNFRGDSALYTWLYRIAINTAKNHIVAQSRRAATVDIEIQDAEHFEESSVLKEYGTPERQLLSQEIEATVFRAIEDLPDDLRTAITLRELEGMSYEEIAHIMDCPIGTVRSRIFRAREAIDKRLKPLLEG